MTRTRKLWGRGETRGESESPKMTEMTCKRTHRVKGDGTRDDGRVGPWPEIVW